MIEKQNIELAMSELPIELQAVLTIFTADQELKRKTLPHVDIGRREIDWHSICRNNFGSGHGAAIAWAKALWSDAAPNGIDLFGRAFAMDEKLKKAVLTALAIRWNCS